MVAEAGRGVAVPVVLEQQLDLLFLRVRQLQSQSALGAQQVLQVQTPAIQEAILFFLPSRQVAVAVAGPMAQKQRLAALGAVREETAVTPIREVLATLGDIAR